MVEQATTWYFTQGVLGVTTLISLAVSYFLYRENKSLTLRLLHKSETDEKENKETARALVDLLAKGRVRRKTIHGE